MQLKDIEWKFNYEILITVFLFLIFLYLIYFIFYKPMNWIRDLTDVGYNFATINTPNKLKIQAINRVMKQRKIGDTQLIPPPFPNGWFAIVESERVKTNQAIDVTCLGQHFVVFRTEKHIVHVLDAYCPHMGANLGIDGTVRGDCIECPFHQWSFSGENGQCVNIPYSTSIPKTAKIRKWISTEINDFIFVWYHAENQEPWKLPIIKEIDSKSFTFIGRNEYTVNCHIRDIPENGADLAHFSVVHSDSILAGNVPKDRFLSSFGTHVWDADWKPNSDPDSSHMAHIRLNHSINFFRKLSFCSLDVRGKQIGPSYVELHMVLFFGPATVLQTVTPIEPLMQKIIHRFYAPRFAAPFVKMLILAESIMFERDVKVWNHKKFVSSPCLVKEDRAIKAYRNWYSQFYSENSKSFIQARETLEW